MEYAMGSVLSMEPTTGVVTWKARMNGRSKSSPSTEIKTTLIGYAVVVTDEKWPDSRVLQVTEIQPVALWNGQRRAIFTQSQAEFAMGVELVHIELGADAVQEAREDGSLK